MPIDIVAEPLIPLALAAAHVPRRRRGRKTSVATLHRWAVHGLRGVVLETLQVGGTKCTSLAALQRFFDGLTTTTATSHKAAVGTGRRRATQAADELDNRWSLTGALATPTTKHA
jgi:hypothetical protein